jgi:hypothetical protein
VKAGCIIGTKSEAPTDPHVEIQIEEMPYIDDDDDDARDLPRPPEQIAIGSVRLDDAEGLEVEEVSQTDDDVVIDEDSPEEHELDAFIEGKKRPSHLQDLRDALDDFDNHGD